MSTILRTDLDTSFSRRVQGAGCGSLVVTKAEVRHADGPGGPQVLIQVWLVDRRGGESWDLRDYAEVDDVVRSLADEVYGAGTDVSVVFASDDARAA